MDNSVIGLFAVVLTMSIPIVAIVFGMIAQMRKRQIESEIRKSIIENHVDAETAKLLIVKPEQEKDTKNYGTLRASCVLLGLGVGYSVDCLIGGLDIANVGYWIIIACGVGLGLLASFFIQRYMEKKEPKSEPTEE
ncbi:MAG: hypothetical protein LKG25_00625 [Prevotella sp.]|jgi:hypothetical protein|nr:hypothetical protein [Prevotella sp.]MCI1281081.1 hypothetical protein [Prevotella sp.]